MSLPSFGSVFSDFGTAISHHCVLNPVLKIPIEVDGIGRTCFAAARIVDKYVYLWNSEADFKGNRGADYVCIAYEVHQLRLEEPEYKEPEYKDFYDIFKYRKMVESGMEYNRYKDCLTGGVRYPEAIFWKQRMTLDFYKVENPTVLSEKVTVTLKPQVVT